MKIVEIPWEYVAPYSIIAGKDGYTWTVLPTQPTFPRIIHRAGRAAVTLSDVGPWDVAPMLILDEREAFKLFVEIFGPRVEHLADADSRLGNILLCPADPVPITHLGFAHGMSRRQVLRMTDEQITELHDALHKGSMKGPLIRTHIHIDGLDKINA